MSCANKLKNIGLAALNHHETQGHFPVSNGYVDPPEAPEKSKTVPAGFFKRYRNWSSNHFTIDFARVALSKGRTS